MAIANTTIRIKKSLTSGNVPSSLANGEIAINSVDGKLFYSTPSGSISYITNSQSFATVNANSSLVLASSPTDILTLVPGTNMSITACTTTKTITFTSTASGGGAYNYFQNTAPTSSNSHDYWTNSDTGVMYENFGNTTSPIWAEVGPTGLLANTTPGLVSASQINVAYTPATSTGAGIQVSAANTKGGVGYADALQITNTSGGATNPNKWIRVTSIGELQVVNSNYQMTSLSLTDGGDLTVAGNTTSNGIAAGYAPNRPAFCVRGNGGQVTATTTLTNSNWNIEYNQGSYLNGSTGIFTAPVAGLYQVNLVIRTYVNNSAGITQALVRKTAAIGGGTTTCIMVEFAPNTSMNHAGGSNIVKLAVGDTLQLIASSGTISFDGNDNWSVAYIG